MASARSISPRTPLVDYYKRVYLPLRLAGKSENTLRLYDVMFSLLRVYFGREPRLADLSDESVQRFMNWHVSQGRSPYTTNKYRCQLLAIWRLACRKQHLKIWPDVAPLPEYKRAPTSWTVEQFSEILAAAAIETRQCHRTINGVPTRVFWQSLLLTIYDTGLRISAALSLEWSDLEFADDQCLVHVRAEVQKDREDANVFLDSQTVAAINELRTHNTSKLLFPWDRSFQAIFDSYKAILKCAGLPFDRRSMFHRIRRTTATMAELHVGPGTANKLLGHSKLSITEAYLDKTKLPRANVAALLPRPKLTSGKGAR